MPRYVIERTLPGGLAVPPEALGAQACCGLVERKHVNDSIAVRVLDPYLYC